MNLDDLRKDLESDAVALAVRGRKKRRHALGGALVLIIAVGAVFLTFGLPQRDADLEKGQAVAVPVVVDERDDFILSDEELLDELVEFGPLLAKDPDGSVELILTLNE